MMSFLHSTIGLLQQMETYLKYKIQVYYTLQLSLGGWQPIFQLTFHEIQCKKKKSIFYNTKHHTHVQL